MAITPFTVDDNVIDVRMNQMVDEVDSAIGQIVSPPMAKYKSTVAKPMTTGVWTEPDWDSKIYDNNNFISLADIKKITINEAGVYLLMANVSFAANVTGYRNVMILKNGAAVAYQTQPPKNAAPITTVRTIVSTVEQCEVGDEFKIQLFQDSGVTLNMDTAVLTFSITKIAGFS